MIERMFELVEVPPPQGAVPAPARMDVTTDEIRTLITRLAADVPADLSNAQRVDLIAALEDATASIRGLQAVLTADLDTATRAEHAAAGVPARRHGAGVASQIGLARRESHWRAARHVGLATVLTTEMPHTLAALRAGTLSEWRATLIARETACLTRADRHVADAELCADPSRVDTWGDRRIVDEARAIAYRLDPHSVVARAANAVGDRYVSCKPAPDTMTWFTALLPVVDGIAVKTTLKRHADAMRSIGDPRSQGQLEADTLVALVTGRPATTASADTIQAGPPPADTATCADIADPPPRGDRRESETRVVVNVVMTDTALFGLDDEPAYVDGYGAVPAPWARNRIAEILDRADVDANTSAWVRRLYAAPETGALVAMESHSRRMRGGLRDLIQVRDRTCRIPYCDAPIAHHDHLRRHADGGATSEHNGAGLCAAHNLDRETPGYHHSTDAFPRPPTRRRRPRELHRFVIVTPSGHRYTSTAPSLPGRIS